MQQALWENTFFMEDIKISLPVLYYAFTRDNKAITWGHCIFFIYPNTAPHYANMNDIGHVEAQLETQM